MIELIYGSDGKVRSAKILKGDAKYRDKDRKLELHSLKHLYPLELSITHNHVAGSEINQNLLDLEIEDFSSIENQNVNLGSVPDVGDLVVEQPLVKDISTSQENQEDESSFSTRDLDPSELSSFDRVMETEPVNVLGGQVEGNEIEQVMSQPSVSSRGRVRKPTKKLMDEFFEFNLD